MTLVIIWARDLTSRFSWWGNWGPFHCPRSCVCMCACFSRVWLFATPWTGAHQALLSMGFSRQECWSGLPCTPLGDLSIPGIEPGSLMSPALAGGFFTTEPPGKPFQDPIKSQTVKLVLKILWVPIEQHLHPPRSPASESETYCYHLSPHNVAHKVIKTEALIKEFLRVPSALMSIALLTCDLGTPLVVQCLRLHLPKQVVWV